MKTNLSMHMPAYLETALTGYNRSAVACQAIERMFQQGVSTTVTMALSRRLGAGKVPEGDSSKVSISLDVELRKQLMKAAAVTGLSEAQLVIYSLEDLFAAAAEAACA